MFGLTCAADADFTQDDRFRRSPHMFSNFFGRGANADAGGVIDSNRELSPPLADDTPGGWHQNRFDPGGVAEPRDVDTERLFNN